MIPLRTPAKIGKFPTTLLVLISSSILLSVLFSKYISSSDSQVAKMISSLVLFPSWPLALLCGWYLWIFAPSFFHREKRRKFFNLAVFFVSGGLVVGFMRFGIEAAWSYTLVLCILGIVMRDHIWEDVDTLVIGPKLFQIYEVPCYVHTFFFLFYVFIAQLIQPAYGMVGMRVYLVALLSFIVGFLVRSLELKA